MKNTPLTQIHIALGAKMADFAGYNMPIQYSSITEEHLAVRKKVGVFDVSHMGEFIVSGKEALEFVQKVTSNDASKLNVGDIQYTCLPNTDGGIVDDLLLYRMQDDKTTGFPVFMLVVNASNMEKDWNWIASYNTFDAEMKNISDQTGLLAVQGPEATAILQKLTDINLSDFKYYTFQTGSFAGIDNALISATG
ncbi:MAG TPA: glycine cleavage system aminomethyltransferase GcvT, partial [Saprospiraceae bacterium]|nr:glycine cleavage system aminomethyltransferase GcvT [Saprospiraceae bacterium]